MDNFATVLVVGLMNNVLHLFWAFDILQADGIHYAFSYN